MLIFIWSCQSNRQYTWMSKALFIWSWIPRTLSSWSLTRIILSRSLVKFYQIHTLCHICKLSGAHLLESPLFIWMVLSKGMAKFHHICPLSQTHCFATFANFRVLFLLEWSLETTCRIILSRDFKKAFQICDFHQIYHFCQIHYFSGTLVAN